ncbi:MAG: hypothetical protein IJP68_00675, partial [Selenomonadaceae bacterium]|nr:hypothetical protein [Selenomonadaceae bacterium]
DTVNIVNAKGKAIKFTVKDVTITNTKDKAKINGTNSKDYIDNSGSKVLINGLSGEDTIINSGAKVTINGDDGSDIVENYASQVTINGGAGNDSINNTGNNVSINGGDDYDTIQTGDDYGHNTEKVSINGGKGNDYLKAYYSSEVTLNGDVGNDEIDTNRVDKLKIIGGSGNDTIYNSNSTNATIDAGADDDHIENYYSDNVSINAGVGNDYIINDCGNSVTIVGGKGNDTIYNNDGEYVTIAGGAGNDSIVNNGASATLDGGAGNDTLTGSGLYSDIFVYSGGKDVITNYSGDDIIYLASGKIDSCSTKGDDLIFHIGKGTLTLKDMRGRAITFKDSSGETTTQIYGGTAYSPQQVIKNLVKAWSESNLWGTDKLDESIKLCSHFNSIQDVIDHMLADYKAAGDADIFLKKYCGIILDNEDTGAITGWNAGGLTYKTTKSVVPEVTKPLRLKDFTNASFVRNNVTFNIAESLDSLTSDGKRVLNGLYSWWCEEALKLGVESYGVKFSEVNTIKFNLETTAYSAGATTWDNKVSINIFSDKDYYDSSYYRGEGVDNVIAHEFTHVAQNLFMGDFPQFLQEGLADLTYGADKDRDWEILEVTLTEDTLKKYLDVENYDTGDGNYYAAGYIFYRYLAKQAADNYNGSITHAWEDNYSIVGTKKADLLTASGNNATITAGKGNDTISAYGDFSKISGDSGDDYIYNSGSDVTISGGAGDDYIENFAKNVVFNYKVGDGADIIYCFDETSTLSITGGEYSVESYGG